MCAHIHTERERQIRAGTHTHPSRCTRKIHTEEGHKQRMYKKLDGSQSDRFSNEHFHIRRVIVYISIYTYQTYYIE